MYVYDRYAAGYKAPRTGIVRTSEPGFQRRFLYFGWDVVSDQLCLAGVGDGDATPQHFIQLQVPVLGCRLLKPEELSVGFLGRRYGSGFRLFRAGCCRRDEGRNVLSVSVNRAEFADGIHAPCKKEVFDLDNDGWKLAPAGVPDQAACFGQV